MKSTKPKKWKWPYTKNKDNLASKKDDMIQKCRQNLRQSDELLFNKDKNKDDFSNKNCISLEIKTNKQQAGAATVFSLKWLSYS